MDQVAQKMSGFSQILSSNRRTGFSLIELVIVMALLGVMAMVIAPMLRGEDLDQERENFVTQLNSMIAGAQYNALVSGKITRVVFDLKHSQIYIEEKSEGKDETGQDKYQLVQVPYNETFFSWDTHHFKMVDFWVNNKNELGNGQDSEKAWFYIVPDGIAQVVIINLRDLMSSEKYNDAGEYSLVLNPFAVQFKLYESFKKPV